MNRRNKLSKLAVLLTLVMALTLIVTALFTPTALAEGSDVLLVTYNGTEQTSSVFDGTSLPTAEGFTAGGKTYTFVGWVAVEALLDEATTDNPTVLNAGDAYGDAKQLHAVYSYDVTTTEITYGDPQWTLVKDASTLEVGDQIIIAAKDSSVAISTTQNPNNRGQADITKNGETATFETSVEVLTLEAGSVADSFAFRTLSGQYLYCASTSSKNYLKTQNGIDEKASWTITISNSTATIKANTTIARNMMQYNKSSSLFACYSSAQQAICIYKSIPEEIPTTTTTTYYATFTTIVTDCDHANTTTVTVDATCTENGSTTVTCEDCGNTISTDTIPATGHDWDDGVETTAPGKGTAGVKTYTCQNDEAHTYTEEIPALGWTATFVVPEGATAPTIPDTLEATMPEGSDAPESFDKHEYEFAGWAMAAIDGEVTEAPTLYKAGDKVTLIADTTFYAVYTWSEGGAVSTDYVLTDVADISETDVVVIVWTKGGTYAGTYAATNDNGSNLPEAVKVTISDKKITGDVANNIKWNVSYNNGQIIIYPNGDATKWMYCIDDNKGIKVGTEPDKTFVIEGNYLKNTTKNRYLGIYNAQDLRSYTTSTTTNIANQTVSFYALKSGGTAYYATALGTLDTTCQHEAEKLSTSHKDATCTSDGYTIVTCSCGVEISEETHEAIGHDYVGNETKAPSCTETGVKTYTCNNCDDVYTEDIPVEPHDYDADTHLCGTCGKFDPVFTNYSGRYYIATVRTSGNYWYMTSVLGDASTKRYQAVDSTLTELPTTITAPEAGYVFMLEKNDDGTYSIYAEGVDGDNYLGWTSGNSGILVAKEDALKLTVEDNEDGTYLIHFTGDEERYLSLNGTSGSDYFAWYKGTQRQNLSLIPVNEPQPEPEPEPEPTVTEFAGAQVSLGADLSVNYKVTLAEGENIADYLVRFTMNDKVVEVTEYTEQNGAYVFTFAGIAPQCAGDNILAELVKNGETVATKDGYSVLANVTNLYNKEGATEATKTLIADLLNYCAAAQKYAGYKTDALVNAGFETAGSTVTPDESDNMFEANASTNKDATVTNATVLFDSVNYVVVTYGARIDGVTIKVNGTELVGTAIGNDLYTVSTEGIGAKNFDAEITIEIFVGEELVQTNSYSINTYIYRVLAGDNFSAEMKELALALYRYGVSAENYAG